MTPPSTRRSAQLASFPRIVSALLASVAKISESNSAVCGSFEEGVRNSSTVRCLVRETTRVTTWPSKKVTLPGSSVLCCQAVYMSESCEVVKVIYRLDNHGRTTSDLLECVHLGNARKETTLVIFK